MTLRVHQAFFAALLLGTQAGAQAGDIYRWVDEAGQTHLSDVVPDKYKDSARHIDSRQYELTPEQQREAAARAARERARASESPAPPAADAPSPATPPAPVSPPVIKRPTEGVTPSTDCATWWRLFRESEVCFYPFRLVGGGIKPEAFEHCNVIPSPEPRCARYAE